MKGVDLIIYVLAAVLCTLTTGVLAFTIQETTGIKKSICIACMFLSSFVSGASIGLFINSIKASREQERTDKEAEEYIL
jgi:hypothetical protein